MNANRFLWCPLLLVCACGTPPPELKASLGIDLSSARGLAIGTVAASLSSGLRPTETTEPKSQLLVMDSNDQLVAANLTTTGTGQPVQLYDTPKAVLIVTRDVSQKGQGCPSVLLRKSDGALFCVPVAPAGPGLNKAARVHWDASGDELVIDTGSTAVRLSFGATDVTQTTLAFDGAELRNIAVNAEGAVLVNLRQDNGTVVRLYPRNGEPQFITGRPESCVYAGPKGSSDFYLANGWYDASPVDRLEHRSDGTFTPLANVWTGSASVWDSCEVVFRSSDRLIVRASTFGLLQVVRPEGAPEIASIPGKISNGSALFDYGQDSEGRAFIDRYDLPSFAKTSLLSNEPLRFGTVNVSPSGEVSFIATRLSDGKRVLGTIRDGRLTLTELTVSQPEVTTLIRIR